MKSPLNLAVRRTVAGSALAVLLAWPLGASAGPADDFDHVRSGFPLTGAHERTRCEECHVRGVFEGTPTRCATCHSVGGPWDAGHKSLTHVPSSNRCDDCHVTYYWSPARFDHAGITGECLHCHNGSFAEGKNPKHVPSSNDCEICHRTLAWSPATFDHSTVVGGCAGCHNGAFASGKTPNHVPTSSDCDTCHNTTRWAVSGGVSHAGIMGGCFDCHNGSTATGKGPTHIASSSTCESCHTTVSWAVSGGFDHTGVISGCSNCHNGTAATGTSSGHFITSLDCGNCHSTSAWLPDHFTHGSSSYPGNHAQQLQCQDCHLGNAQNVSWPTGAYQPDCAGCHANDFEPGPHKKVDNPTILYTVSELRDCTGSCHMYTDQSFTTIEKTRASEHRVGKGDW